MSLHKKTPPQIKEALHPRNLHRKRYDFNLLIKSTPSLSDFVKPNKFGDLSIDFFNPMAVIALNKALLKQYYGIENWDIPKGYLCPPVPGRADYMHYVADLLEQSKLEALPQAISTEINVLDIGVGANCIYPIIGAQAYHWSFVGTDIDSIALANAQKIITTNPSITNSISFRKQDNPNSIFNGIIHKDDFFHLSICNPPFHQSQEEATQGSLRKLKNLTGQEKQDLLLNFGGQSNELWCRGGDEAFLRSMIYQSQHYAENVLWFTSLVAKKSTLKTIYKTLKKVKAKSVKTIPMGQGNKVSRIVAWSFFNEKE